MGDRRADLSSSGKGGLQSENWYIEKEVLKELSKINSVKPDKLDGIIIHLLIKGEEFVV